MTLGSFLISGVNCDEIFDLNSVLNRDDALAPWVLLKERFNARNIGFHTADMNKGKKQGFSLHLNVLHCTSCNDYLLMLETPQIHPDNGCDDKLAGYKRIFTWNDELVDGNRFIKINFPSSIKTPEIDGFGGRPDFCCLIASNRALTVKDSRNLYIERIKAIRWFERNAPTDFALYGKKWDIPAARGGFGGRIESKLWSTVAHVFPLKPFPSYRGKIDKKCDALTRTRFAICYENVRDLPGYITEKIFDCFFSGCIPVYWGASNVEQHIPASCFIDRRKFSGMEELYCFLKEMPEKEFIAYQQHIVEFLQSDAVYPFGAEFFADTIVNTIVQDLGCQA